MDAVVSKVVAVDEPAVVPVDGTVVVVGTDEVVSTAVVVSTTVVAATVVVVEAVVDPVTSVVESDELSANISTSCTSRAPRRMPIESLADNLVK